MPLSGMTGFGRAEGASGDWSWSVEARSVNGRNLEIRYRGVPGFEALDRTARDAAQARFQRGNVTIAITGKRSDAAGKVTINLEQLERYLAAGAPYVAEGRAATPSLDGLLALRGVIEAGEAVDDPETLAQVEAAMAASLNAALDALLANRREEGASLALVLAGQIDRIAGLVIQAETEAAGQTAAIKERFERRMNELAPDAPGVAERIVVEAAALAVKADVREELDRLAGHVEAARTLMAGEGPAGRRLDFLTQEFMREANTLCSKSALPGLTTVGLDLKATIEQFREQVQNVE
ncbi:YicC/YloC family endoribonuclease [Phenylobacterium sp.]|uniref:YicC/YloC family endoribonuclease n=1 Tax=Phenylobacterium sp. TaxID=1871053 RepID=UPI0027290ABA|nr:YicC/YloC family endoribonuclease [Phenylobacterium sp.]MDO8377420.1 YicC/YloC family endoribonuclease [Phenylobacterium sp.]